MSVLDLESEYGLFECRRCGDRDYGYYEPDFGRVTKDCRNCGTPGMTFIGDGEDED